jgi:hypothetical protein
MAFVQAMVAAYMTRGLDPSHALSAAQIAPDSVADPAARITAVQMEAVSEAAMRELDDEALGCFRRALPWGSYGMLARASLSAPTLGVALKRWCRHHALLTDDVALALHTEGDTARLVLTADRRPGALTEFCAVSVLRNVLGLACWLVDSRCKAHAFPTWRQRTWTPTACCSTARPSSTSPTPRCTWMPATSFCRSGATKPP